MKNKKILLAVVAVAVAAAVTVGVILLLPDHSEKPSLEATQPVATAPESTQPPETENAATEKPIYDYYPLVTFVTHGSETTQRVEPGSLPQIPSGQSGYDHLVFTGWNRDIAAVTEDTVYEAVYEDVSEKDNVFVLDTVYTTADSADLTLGLRGKVGLCVADLQISYDPTVIRVEQILKADSSVQYNVLPGEGRIKVSILMEEDLAYAMDCFVMRVSFVDPQANAAMLDISVDDAASQASGTLVDADSQTISGKIIRVS